VAALARRTWVGNYTKDSAWTGKLRCTPVTLKCGEYREPKQTLMESYDSVPSYKECACENLDQNANYHSFGVAFITLIRMSTGEYWNGLMHDLMDGGHTLAILFFMSFTILAEFIMLNLVVAVLLINYEEMVRAPFLPSPAYVVCTRTGSH
jgi:hypothetical protein